LKGHAPWQQIIVDKDAVTRHVVPRGESWHSLPSPYQRMWLETIANIKPSRQDDLHKTNDALDQRAMGLPRILLAVELHTPSQDEQWRTQLKIISETESKLNNNKNILH